MEQGHAGIVAAPAEKYSAPANSIRRQHLADAAPSLPSTFAPGQETWIATLRSR
jgi:hypothetical protein